MLSGHRVHKRVNIQLDRNILNENKIQIQYNIAIQTIPSCVFLSLLKTTTMEEICSCNIEFCNGHNLLPINRKRCDSLTWILTSFWSFTQFFFSSYNFFFLWFQFYSRNWTTFLSSLMSYHLRLFACNVRHYSYHEILLIIFILLTITLILTSQL